MSERAVTHRVALALYNGKLQVLSCDLNDGGQFLSFESWRYFIFIIVDGMRCYILLIVVTNLHDPRRGSLYLVGKEIMAALDTYSRCRYYAMT